MNCNSLGVRCRTSMLLMSCSNAMACAAAQKELQNMYLLTHS